MDQRADVERQVGSVAITDGDLNIVDNDYLNPDVAAFLLRAGIGCIDQQVDQDLGEATFIGKDPKVSRDVMWSRACLGSVFGEIDRVQRLGDANQSFLV